MSSIRGTRTYQRCRAARWTTTGSRSSALVAWWSSPAIGAFRYRTAEKRAWVEHRVRGFVLTGRRSQSTADSRAILERQWASIEALVESAPEGPWMRSVTESGVRVIDL